MTPKRPLLQMSTDQLKKLADSFVASGDMSGVARVLDELEYRLTPGAVRLKADLLRYLQGVPPRPDPPRSPAPPAPVQVPVPPPAPPPVDVEPEAPIDRPGVRNPDPAQVVRTRDGVSYVAAIGPAATPSPEPSIFDDVLAAPSCEGLPGVGEDPTGPSGSAPSKVVKLFEFVQAWRDLADPPPRRYEEYQWHQRLGDLPRGLEGEVRTASDPGTREEGVVLSVRRPRPVRAPEPPAVLVGWLAGDPSDWRSSLGWRVQRLIPSGRSEQRVELFSSDPARVSAWAAWMSKWYAWAIDERERSQVAVLYAKLFELRGLIEGRSHELELAVGGAVLDWKLAGDASVRHPLLMKRVSLEFDNQRAEITIRDSDAPVEFASRTLGQTPVAGRGIALARRICDELQPHPLDRDSVVLFLRGVMNTWFGDLSFRPGGPPRPDLRVAPVLVLRGAGSQVGAFVERILADLKRGAPSPDFLHWLTGESQPPSHFDGDGAPSERERVHQADDDEDGLFFTKPANQEQRRILRLLDRQSAIVVQGPPGTGKTHTIGNLIGHFLSQGMRVLVTSETEKALGEVRNQVVPGLNSLCVPLLGTDRHGRDLLRQCLEGINNQAAQRTKSQLVQDVADHEEERRRLLARRRELRRKLFDARTSEVVPIVVAGAEFRPIEAAKRVAQAGDSAQWIPGPVTVGLGLPLDRAELVQLYASNEVLSADDDRALALPLPDPQSLPQPDVLDGLLSRRTAVAADGAFDRPAAWTTPAADAGELEAVASATSAALRDLEGAEPWRLAAVDAGVRGESATLTWRRMVDVAKEADRLHGEAREVVFEHEVDLGGLDDAKALKVALDIQEHINEGRQLHRWWGTLCDKSWKPYVDTWRLGDRSPSTAGDFAAIATYLSWRVASRDFVQRFAALVTSDGGPDPVPHGDDAAVVLRQHVEVISRLLDWHATMWKPLRDRLTRLGLRMEALQIAQCPMAGRFAEAQRLVSLLRSDVAPLVRGRRGAVATAAIMGELAAGRSALASHQTRNPQSRPLSDALRSWDAGDLVSYRAALGELARQRARVAPWQLRHSLLARLQSAAPAWAEAIRGRRGVHGSPQVPGDPVEAWLIRQFDEALAERQRASIAQLSQELAEVERALPKVTANLVSAKAWGHQINRLASESGTALRQFADLMRRSGTGTGLRAKGYLRRAQELSSKAMMAVPVWIMPIWRVFQTVVPSSATRFDVVIVDEASQANLKALPLLYLAKRVVIVGDEEQVTPAAVGERVDDLRRLQSEYLEGFRVPEIFDGTQSLYTIAQTHFGVGTTALREHFRCVPDIIAFSNHIAYLRNGRALLPLRDAHSAMVAPAVVPYRVAAGDASDGENLAEAKAVTALLGAMLDHPAYRGATFGVIHLVGDQQDRVIETLVREQLQLDDEQIERIKGGGGSTRRLCGKPPDFQGDERSVVILSMVDGPTPGGPLSMRATPMFNQRFNVAASRAKDQLWVVHSLDHARDLQAGDLRRRLIEHSLNPSTLRKEMEALGAETESPFEREVLAALLAAGYDVIPQYRVGALRIDLLVTDGTRRLAVECDGERFHPPERLLLDMERQRVLERLGHTFHRIRGSAFYRQRERVLAQLFERVRELGIQPKSRVTEPAVDSGGEGLRSEIVRSAEQRMVAWGWLSPPLEGGRTSARGRRMGPVGE